MGIYGSTLRSPSMVLGAPHTYSKKERRRGGGVRVRRGVRERKERKGVHFVTHFGFASIRFEIFSQYCAIGIRIITTNDHQTYVQRYITEG